MILILIALVSVTVLGIWASSRSDRPLFSNNVAPFFATVGFFGLIIYSIYAYNYIAAEYKANILNREYQTNYSQEELFYASNVIDTVRQLDRNRIELNGNLMNCK